HARDLTLPGMVKEQITGVAIHRRVLVVNDEVGQAIVAAHVGEHDRGPTVVGDAGARVDDRMVGVVGRAVFSDVNDRANFNGRVGGLHFGIVVGEAHGVGPGVVRFPGGVGVPVQFPTAADFVADLPILEVAVVGDIEHANPKGRFIAVAAAVIADDESLGVRVGGQSHEIG